MTGQAEFHIFESLAFPAVAWVLITSLMALLSRNWRATVTGLALQYVGVFALAALRWPLEMAVAKLVAGWMASAVLGIAASEAIFVSPERSGTNRIPPGTYHSLLQESETAWPSSRVFRILAAGLIWLTVYSLSSKAASWIPGVGLAQAWGGLALIGMGLLHLGLTARPLRVVAALLTALSGFEILYAAVESSALLAGLLAATHMGLALAGAYLLITNEVRTTSGEEDRRR